MQPIKSAAFLLVVLSLLLVLSYFAPTITRYAGLDFIAYPELDFLTVIQEEKPIAGADTFLDTLSAITFLPDSLLAMQVVADTAMVSDTSAQQHPEPEKEPEPPTEKRTRAAPRPSPLQAHQVQSVEAKTLLQRGQAIEYPDANKHILQPFFHSLSGLSGNTDLIRILHYGDSQIEGDRITSYIRNRFQTTFGGSGIGLFPVQNMKDHNISIQLTTSDNWRQYYIRDRVDIPDEHKQYGILTGFARYNAFSAYRVQDRDTYEAWMRVERQSFSYPLSRPFNRFRVFYGFNQAPLIAQMTSNDVSLDADIIEPSFGLQVLEWVFDETPNTFELHFQGEDSPNIFAIALDGDRGVAVDNLPLRGSSGLEFTQTNRQFFRAMYRRLNVKMVLLQFGVNVAPHVVDNYQFYENRLYNQLVYLKELNPDLAIVVMGISDIAQRAGTGYASYPNVELIRNAQRRAAFRAGCAFWDVYQAMGGENAMVRWVFSDPPLAVRDFIHFNHQGAVLIAEMFYDALMNDYNEYLEKQ